MATECIYFFGLTQATVKKKPKKSHDLEFFFFLTKICTSKDFSNFNSDNKHCFEHLSGYAMSRRTTKPTKWSDSVDQIRRVSDDLIIEG